jgi:hypothetical protein
VCGIYIYRPLSSSEILDERQKLDEQVSGEERLQVPCI